MATGTVGCPGKDARKTRKGELAMQQSKRARALSYSAAVLLGGLVAFGGDANAQGFGQFLGGKAAGTSPTVRVFNPTNVEMIALWIEFDDTGNFDNCTGKVIAPFGTDNDEFDFSGSGATGLLISVPTSNEGKNAGKIKDGKFGVVARSRKRSYLPTLNTKNFKLHPDEVERDAQLAACCTEIEDEGEPRKIFKAFKMVCPEFGGE